MRPAIVGATSVAAIALRNCAVNRLPATTSLISQRRVSAGRIGPSRVVAIPATMKPMCRAIGTSEGEGGMGASAHRHRKIGGNARIFQSPHGTYALVRKRIVGAFTTERN